MTFLEAAIEILRGSEEPLHITEIARLAVERRLLSHVGRDPEAAMRSCLNSAVRSKVHDGLVMRSKPGHYLLRAGATLPELPPPPTDADPLPEPEPVPEVKKRRSSSTKKVSKNKKKASKTSKAVEEAAEPKEAPKRTRRRKKVSRKKVVTEDEQLELEPAEDAPPASAEEQPASEESEAPSAVDAPSAEEEASGEDPNPSAANLPTPDLDPSKVRFRGPQGSGLEGDTDITLVMANAMSRLVEDRPELREELEAMQKPQAPAVEVIEVGRKRRRDEEPNREERNREDRSREDRNREDRNRDEERGGRRRRRRRRRNRRVEWSGGSGSRDEQTRGEELLDKVAAALADAGPRSLHVRQIAENLAAQDILGGEISEIERAVTAAILLDVHRRADGSRFLVRGDGRYQLRGSRLPEKAAQAEHALRGAARVLEKETENQLLLWLQSLGARALEALVRVWLAREKFTLLATLPPSRGLGKLVVEDPDPEEEEARTLVLIFPRKTSLEPKLWDGEAERNGCGSTLVFAMCEPVEPVGETRVIFARDLVRWLLRHGIGVCTLTIQVPALDANLIESIGGLDT